MKAERYQHVLQLALETPWAVLPSTLATIREVLAMRASGERFTEQELQERLQTTAGPRGRGGARRVGGATSTIAVVPLCGVIFPRANLMTEYSGGTSLQQFSADLIEAVNDDQVAAVVLDIDSPGGSTALVAETAALIRQARDVKPIVASINTLGASAAYWLASQATEIAISPSGLAGSIGVLLAHEDHSSENEMLGINTTLITAGRKKAQASPFAPLSDEAKADLQALVDDTYGSFIAAVAAGRGVSTATVQADYGQGWVLTPSEALKAGMVDRIEAFSDTVARVASGALPTTRRGARAELAPVEPSAIAPLIDLEALAARPAESHADKPHHTPTSADEREAYELSLDLCEQVAGKEKS